jgi:P4 family phage/plasmid primase-like protien
MSKKIFSSAMEILKLFPYVNFTSKTINNKGCDVYKAICPCHNDNTESLSICDDKETRRIIVYCHAGCVAKDIFKQIGISPSESYYDIKPVEHYNYYDEDNNFLFQVTRMSNKTFPRYPKNTATSLYKLPELLKSESDLVILVEGEKDVNNLTQFDFMVTSVSNGANSFSNDFIKYFAKKHVIMIADNDEAGKKYAKKIKHLLPKYCLSLKIGYVPVGKDASDYIEYLEKNKMNVRDNFLQLFSNWNVVPIANFFDDDGVLKPYLLSQHIMDKYSLILHNKVIYTFYNGNYIIADLDTTIRKEWRDITIRQVKETIADIYAYATIKENESSPNYIKVKNGIFDINTDTLHDNSEKYFITNIIPHNYNPDAYNLTLDEVLNHWSGYCIEKRMLIEEIFGYCLYRRSCFKKFFIFQGETNVGKSTFLNLFKILVGKNNHYGLKLEELTKDFSAVNLISKLVNVGDDISGKTLKDSDMLKSLTSGHQVQVANKYEKEVSLCNYATLIFACNQVPKMPDISGGLDSRHIIIPLSNQVKTIDYDLSYKIESDDAMEYLLLLAINGLKRLLKQNGFTIPVDVAEAINDCKINNNSVLAWIDQLLDVDAILERPITDVYQEYVRFVNLNGGIALGSIVYSRELVRTCKGIEIRRKRSNNSIIKIFSKIGEIK